MHYNIVKFKMKHLETFRPREEQKAELAFLMNHPEFQDCWERALPIFTLMADDIPVFIYGMQNSKMGTYYPMAFAAEGIDKHRFAVVRCIYDYVEKFVGEDVRRFEANVLATDTKAMRLARFFGLEPVGIRRQASVDGLDQVLYERLWRK